MNSSKIIQIRITFIIFELEDGMFSAYTWVINAKVAEIIITANQNECFMFDTDVADD
jgi:hypothetical protein